MCGVLPSRYGYDWKGDWYDKIGSNEIWTNALEGLGEGSAWELPLAIVLASQPFLCLDPCPASVASARCTKYYASYQAVTLNTCDPLRAAQKWRFNETSWEIVNVGSVEAGVAPMCLAWGTAGAPLAVKIGAPLEIHACDGQYRWDPAFYVPTEVRCSARGGGALEP